ncbi:MAG: hypothetical protein KDA85_06395, partial [Planctomycetaceae bacterium]|nr:hypothetical protein [Planctomycetaceae bacterium]
DLGVDSDSLQFMPDGLSLSRVPARRNTRTWSSLGRSSLGVTRQSSNIAGFPAPSPIVVEPPTFQLRGVLPAITEAVAETATFPDELKTLFPDVGHRTSPPSDEAVIGHKQASDWPENVVRVCRELERPVIRVQQGLQIQMITQDVHETRGTRRINNWHQINWIPSRGWTWRRNSSEGPVLYWSFAEESGSLLEAFRTGISVELTNAPTDCRLPVSLIDERFADLRRTFARDYTAAVASQDKHTTMIELTHRVMPWQRIRITVDNDRHTITLLEELEDGLVIRREVFSGHQQVGNVWIAGDMQSWRLEPVSHQLTLRHTQSCVLTELNSAELEHICQQQIKSAHALDSESPALILPSQLPDISASRRAIEDGVPTFADQFVRILPLMQTGQWDDADRQLKDALEQHHLTAAGRWLRWQIMLKGRRSGTAISEITNPASVAVMMQQAGMIPDPDGTQSDAAVAVAAKLRALTQPFVASSRLTAMLQQLETLLHESSPDQLLIMSLMQQRAEQLAADQQWPQHSTILDQIHRRWPMELAPMKAHLESLRRQRRTEDLRALFAAELNPQQRWSEA